MQLGSPGDRRKAPEPEQRVEVRIDLTSATRHLTSRERKLVALLARGLSHREIADHLGIGWKSVGVRIQRLRRKLRLLLLERAPGRW